MKKNVFALSVAAALAVLAGSASAQSIATSNSTSFEVNAGGIGHIQLIPYYTVQNSNNTLLNIVNTDQVNGKAVKVRFRGARNSDDVFDFYLLLSPGDVWRSRVYRDEQGNTRLDLNGDTSCTYPSNAVVQASAFPTGRVYNGDVAETREGYVELLTAADIPRQTTNAAGETITNPLYTAIKHVNSKAPCTDTVIDSAFYDPLVAQTVNGDTVTAETVANRKGFFAPTTGLIANWAVMNVATGSTASGNGTALQAVAATAGDIATGNIVIAPQRTLEQGESFPANWLANGSTDPLLNNGAIDAAFYDYPDLSTPYLQGVTAAQQANLVSDALSVSQIINEFTTVEAGFKTDWVFSLPTRRYGVAIDYAAAGTTADPKVVYNHASAFFSEKNAKLNPASTVPSIKIDLTATYWDKEENNTSTRQGAVISPSTPEGLPYISGEVNVFTFNGNAPESILGGTIAYNNIAPQFNNAAIESGWANFKLAAAPGDEVAEGTPAGVVFGKGLPVIGYSTMTAGNGINLTYTHRFNK